MIAGSLVGVGVVVVWVLYRAGRKAAARLESLEYWTTREARQAGFRD